MKVEPRIKGNICVTAHPAGCAAQVNQQIDYVRGKPIAGGPRRALIIGSSNGYGLAMRIVAAFGSGSATAGVFYEREGSDTRLGTAGWYNNLAFEREAAAEGHAAASLNGDAFSAETKERTMALLRDEIGPADLIVYSIAAPRRIDPDTGEIYSTAIKPIGSAFAGRTLDIVSGELRPVAASPATAKEIEHTVKVMGGEDWLAWIDALQRADLIAEGATTVALSYIGPELTAPIYRHGTIGRAKQHLEQTARVINDRFASSGVEAVVSINKALVTRASAVIPAVTLYISLLYQVMKRKGLHEDCIEQVHRLFADHLYTAKPVARDAEGRIRLDDLEMREDVQREVAALWHAVGGGDGRDVSRLADIADFRGEFLRHHGFEMPGVDYVSDVEPR